MPIETPFQTIETMTAVLLASSARMHLRSFAVGSRGKKCEMTVAKWIAEAIGPRFLYPLEFRDGDRVAQAEEITAVVEQTLLSVPDADATMLVSKNDHHRKEARDMIGEMVARRLTNKYEIVRLDRSMEHLRPRTSDGQWWETGDLAP